MLEKINKFYEANVGNMLTDQEKKKFKEIHIQEWRKYSTFLTLIKYYEKHNNTLFDNASLMFLTLFVKLQLKRFEKLKSE